MPSPVPIFLPRWSLGYVVINVNPTREPVLSLRSLIQVVYVLTTLMPELLEDDTVEAIRRRAKWVNDDYICRGHILNGMSDPLFDIYENMESAKELWDSLESKYMAEDASSKKFIIKKSLRTQESDKGKGKEVAGPSVNMMEEGGKNKNKKQNKGKKHGFKDNNGGSGSNKNPKLECWKCGKTGHFKRDCRSGNKKNNASASGLGKGSKDQSQDQVEDGYVLYMGDDHFAPVHGKGSVVLEFNSGKSITLFNVLYVPKLRIIHETTAPYTPQQNGMAERKNRALKEMVNSILSYSSLSEGFWGEAMLTACYLLNKFPNKRNKTTPYELWFYVIKPNDSVSINSIIESRDAIFDENHLSSIPRPKDIIPNSDESLRDDHFDDVPSEIPEPRKGCKPFGCKWIFKRKMKVDGTIDKFKARLVIQGFRQKEGIDYFDTYSPVARITAIRLLLALAAIHNLVIHQMDVKTTFLNGDLEEEVYMKQPEGFVMPGNKHKVCKLVKLLYGLKQAPKQWHQKFDEVVLSSGFLLNQSDKCVYSKFDGSDKSVIICLYVDNMLIFGTDQNQVDKTKKFLSLKFSMKDMGEADVILGIKIKRENKGIVITQSHYIEKILKKFNRENCYSVSTPMDPVEKLMPNTGKPVDQLKYSRAIGCLMYAMTSTRPDIAYAVGRLSRFTSNPSRHHWHAITRINHVKDSSSTSGWVFMLGGGAILWASKKQTCITSSTMESEFVALAAASKEAEWLRNLIHEILIWPNPIAPISIHCDSAATLAKAYSQIYNGKSRHLGVRHSMIRELIMNGVISIEFVRSQHNLADHLTKALARDLVIKSVIGMGLKSI
ncbi:zinc finger, CCHC-type containing protein [Tanacetum coccineum]